MAISYFDQIGVFQLKINGNCDGGDYGFSEVYHCEPMTSLAAIRQLGSDLAGFRANLLYNDHTIKSCRYYEVGNKGKTLKCLAAPLMGTWPTAAVVTATEDQVSQITAVGGGSTAAIAEFTFNSEDVFQVDDGDTQVDFLWEGDAFTHVTRGFHGVPDFYANDRLARNISGVSAWFGATTYVAGTVPGVDNNYFSNYPAFFDLIIAKFRIVKKPGSGQVPLGTDANLGKKFAFCEINRVAYEAISKSPIGRPHGLPVGRRIATS